MPNLLKIKRGNATNVSIPALDRERSYASNICSPNERSLLSFALLSAPHDQLAQRAYLKINRDVIEVSRPPLITFCNSIAVDGASAQCGRELLIDRCAEIRVC
jgi:hypothetical protein